MKKVFFKEKNTLEFIFENNKEIISLLKGEQLKIPLDKNSNYFAIFELEKGENENSKKFEIEEFPNKHLFYIEFFPQCLKNFLAGTCKKISYQGENKNICIYAPGCYNNKDYLNNNPY